MLPFFHLDSPNISILSPHCFEEYLEHTICLLDISQISTSLPPYSIGHMGASPHSVWETLYKGVIHGGEELWKKLWRLAITNCIYILRKFSAPSKYPHI